MNDNTTQNLWNTSKAVLRRKCIVLNANIRQDEMPQINNLSSHLRELEKDEQNKSIASVRKRIKIRARIDESVNWKTIRNINKTKTRFSKNQ